MGKKEIRLKMFLLPLMLAIVLTEATGSQAALDSEVNLPAIVFHKQHGIPGKFQETTGQNNFCAAFPFADGTFVTSAHCLATAQSIDLVGLGKVDIEKIETHPVLDLTAFQLKNRYLIPASWHVGLNSKSVEDTCTVVVLNEAFRWTVLHGVTPTLCPDNASENKICFKSEKIPTGLDFAVVCEFGRTLHAVFHSQRGLEISFTVCSTAHGSEFIKQNAMIRVKRQVDDAAVPAPDTGTPPADSGTPPVDSGTPPADSGTPPADSGTPSADTGAPSADTGTPPAAATGPSSDVASPTTAVGSPASNDSSAPATSSDTSDVPLPPPKQLFSNLPPNFPYPDIAIVQSPPVPTRSRKRPGLQNTYPVQAPSGNVIPELPAINLMPGGQPTPQIKEQATPEGDMAVQVPTRTESPHTSDLTEYEVLGAHDAPVLLANNDVKENEDPTENQHIAATQHVTASDDQYAIPAAVQHRTQRPSSGGFAMAPADWRYSVTPRPHRKCKTTTSRPSCRAPQPSPSETGSFNYHEQMAAVPAGTVGAVSASRPVGPDPWMMAAHEAVPTGVVIPKQDEKPADKPVESAAKCNSLAAISVLLANALYFFL